MGLHHKHNKWRLKELVLLVVLAVKDEALDKLDLILDMRTSLDNKVIHSNKLGFRVILFVGLTYNQVKLLAVMHNDPVYFNKH
ncbi:MAG: hypothetical protein CML19_01630 [Pusillimonas sp.]|nr:hypothetical protein [Pusillimonas sp.]